MKQRLEYLDAVKFLTILLVIVGHYLAIIDCGIIGQNTTALIYSFHMPLFMIVSGFFSASSYSKSFYPFVQGKLKTLILPVITWTILITIYSLLTHQSEERIITEIKGNSWFLKTLFVCYLLVYTLKRTKIPDAVLCIISIFICFVIPLGCTFQFNWMLSFFWIGYFLKKHQTYIEKYRINLFLLSFLTYPLGLWLMFRYQYTGVLLITPISLINEWHGIAIRYLISLTGSIVFIGCVRLLFEKVLCNRPTYLGEYGKYTLGIYVMQTFIIQYLFADLYCGGLGVPFAYLAVWIFSLISVLTCVRLIKIMCRNPILNLLLFGGQYSYHYK